MSMAHRSNKVRRKPELDVGQIYRKTSKPGLNNDLESDGSLMKSLKSDSVGRRLKIHLNMQKKKPASG